jgi:hypothetical protein
MSAWSSLENWVLHLGAGLLWLFISGVTIEIAVYIFSWELKMDLSRSDVDDHIGSVEEGDGSGS